jgi:hypothetical protein
MGKKIKLFPALGFFFALPRDTEAGEATQPLKFFLTKSRKISHWFFGGGEKK